MPGFAGFARVPLQTRPPRSKIAQFEHQLNCHRGQVQAHESPRSSENPSANRPRGYPGSYYSATYFVLWTNLKPLVRVLSRPVDRGPRSLRSLFSASIVGLQITARVRQFRPGSSRLGSGVVDEGAALGNRRGAAAGSHVAGGSAVALDQSGRKASTCTPPGMFGLNRLLCQRVA